MYFTFCFCATLPGLFDFLGSVFPGSAIIIGSIAGMVYMAAEDITMKSAAAAGIAG